MEERNRDGAVQSRVFTPPGPSRKAPGAWRKPGGNFGCFEQPCVINITRKR